MRECGELKADTLFSPSCERTRVLVIRFLCSHPASPGSIPGVQLVPFFSGFFQVLAREGVRLRPRNIPGSIRGRGRPRRTLDLRLRGLVAARRLRAREFESLPLFV